MMLPTSAEMAYILSLADHVILHLYFNGST